MSWNDPPIPPQPPPANSPPPPPQGYSLPAENPYQWTSSYTGGVTGWPPRRQNPPLSPGLKAAIAIFAALSIISVSTLIVAAILIIPTIYGEPFDPSSQTTISRSYLESSVVRVSGEACNFEKFGTGFFVDSGVVVTNAHVVAGVDFPSIGYGVSSRQVTVNATVVYFDPDDDLAVLRTSLTGNPLPLSSSDPKKGDPLFAPGFPRGGDFEVKQARFQASIEVYGESIYGNPVGKQRFLAIESSLEPGNSGSPVVDQAGYVVGVASAVSRERTEIGVVIPYERVAFALTFARSSVTAVGTGSCYTKEG